MLALAFQGCNHFPCRVPLSALPKSKLGLGVGIALCSSLPYVGSSWSSLTIPCVLQIAHELLWVYGSSTPKAWQDALAHAAELPPMAFHQLIPGSPESQGWQQNTKW